MASFKTGKDITGSVECSSSISSTEDDTSSSSPLQKRKYRRHAKLDKNAPIKPPSAYVMFSNDIRKELKDYNMSFTELARIVGNRWKNIDQDTKQRYEEAANKAKDDYLLELSEYQRTEEYKVGVNGAYIPTTIMFVHTLFSKSLCRTIRNISRIFDPNKMQQLELSVDLVKESKPNRLAVVPLLIPAPMEVVIATAVATAIQVMVIPAMVAPATAIAAIAIMAMDIQPVILVFPTAWYLKLLLISLPVKQSMLA
jgi:hypothetical protein